MMNSRRAAVILAFLVAFVGLVNVTAARSSLNKYFGTVTEIVDGDTLMVNFDNHGEETVRLLGLDTHEWYACYGPEATARMEQLVQPGTRVRLRGDINVLDALDRVSMRVWVGKKDLTRVMLKEGFAIPRPEPELTNKINKRYRKAAWNAQQAGLGIWDPTLCGDGPQQNIDIRIEANYEADGKDDSNLAGEWIKIHNDGNQSLDVSGWMLRDASRVNFVFPNGASIPANDSILVLGGLGGSGNGIYHFGNTHAFLSAGGDGVYLQDVEPGIEGPAPGDIRAFVEFPCLFQCTDQLQGKVEISVQYDADGKDKQNVNGEWVDFWNVSGQSVDLYNHVVERGTYTYYFDESAVIPAGQSLRLHIGQGTDNGLVRYWGRNRPLFNNLEGKVEFRSLDGTTVDVYRWPCNPCEPTADLRIEFVNPDAPGVDDENPNGEFIDVRNHTSSAVPMAGWTLQTGGKKYYFPSGYSLGAGQRVRVHVGSGSDTQSTLYWGRDTKALGNATDLVELVSPQNAVAFCYGWGGSACDIAPNWKPLSITVDYTGSVPNDESFAIRNTGNSSIDMTGYKVVYNGEVYEFGNFTLGAGNTVTLFVGSGGNTATKRYWGLSDPFIRPQGTVDVFDGTGAKAKSHSWS